ncbi:MAG: META domain-containing protein [Flavobacteriaceae bacterium]|nr:META domain-containing protein [Flavobacteriaceae bacterium]
MKTVFSIILASLLLVACDETKKVIDVAGNVQLSGLYKVTSIDNNQISENNPTLNFVALDKSIRGNTGCNNYFGKYNLDLYALSFADIASTEMACDSTIMDTENAFMNALNNTGSYDLENSALTLYSKVDRSILLIAIKERNSGN